MPMYKTRGKKRFARVHGRATSSSGRCTLNDAARLVNAVNGAEGGRDPVANENVGERRSFMAKQSILLFPLAQIPTGYSHCTNKTRSGSRTIFGFRPCHASRGRGDGMGIDPRAKLKRIRDDADSSRDTANNNNHTSIWTFVTVHCAKE